MPNANTPTIEPQDTTPQAVAALERCVTSLEEQLARLSTQPTPVQAALDWWRTLALPPDADLELQREIDEECRRIREEDRRTTAS